MFPKALRSGADIVCADLEDAVPPGEKAAARAVAFAQRALVRGVAAVDAVAVGRPGEHEPVYPLAFYVTKSAGGRVKPPQVDAFAATVRGLKYPVTVKDLGATGRQLNAEELAELVRWMDTLDRI